jgi:FkbM family methyltransferase
LDAARERIFFGKSIYRQGGMMAGSATEASRVIEFFGKPFQLDDLDSLGLSSGAAFSQDELAFIEASVGPGDVCIDIGANIGVFTVALARAAGPRGRVYSFEPDPENFNILQTNSSAWVDECDIQLHRAACGAENGRAVLHRSTENRGMHRLYDSPCCQGDGVEVATVVVDEIVTDDVVRLIKIDIEGYEPFALPGFTAITRRSANVLLLTEFSPISMLDAGTSAVDYVNALIGLDLYPHRIESGKLAPLNAGEILENCARLQAGDFSGMREMCQGRNSAEIFDIATSFASRVGFQGPIIENLVFARKAGSR